MLKIVLGDTLYSLERSPPVITNLIYLPLISITCSLVNFAVLLFSPDVGLNLFLIMQSLILSECVPRNKCDGFIHGGLSHL